MHKLFVLATDADQIGHDPSLVITRPEGRMQTSVHVAALDGLLRDRHEALSEERPQSTMAEAMTRTTPAWSASESTGGVRFSMRSVDTSP